MMTGDQIVFLAAAFLILALITVAAQFHWMGEGRLKSVLTFISGVLTIVSLRLAELPPAWFAGTASGFGIALSLTVGSFLGRTAEERSFGFPLLFGMGLTLFVANVVQAVMNAL